jgi:hypothetical protein
MKPVPILIVLITMGVAVTAVSWLSKLDVSSAEQTAAAETRPQPVNENPFEVAATGPFPKAVLDNGMHEFASLELGQTGKHAFVVTNEGDAVLKLKVGHVDCKCTVAKLEKEEVPPGQSVEILMEWTPVVRAEEFHQMAEIWTNDPEQEKLELHVKGAVEQLALLFPQGEWTLNRIQEEESTQFQGVLCSRLLDEFQITGFESESELLDVKWEPLDEEGLAMNEAKSGYLITGSLNGEMPIGRFNTSLTLMTDMVGGRDFTVKISGVRPGPLSILGKNWLGGEMLLKMGDVKASEGKSMTLSVFAEPAEKPLEFEIVESNPPVLTLSLKHDESFNAPTKERYLLTIAVPPGAPLGQWSGENEGTMRVRTNRDSFPEIEMYVEMTVHE